MGVCAPFPVQVKFCKGTGESMREAKQRILIADDSAMNRAILTEMLGDNTNVYITCGEQQAILKVDSHDTPETDAPMTFRIPAESIYLFDGETENVIQGSGK